MEDKHWLKTFRIANLRFTWDKIPADTTVVPLFHCSTVTVRLLRKD